MSNVNLRFGEWLADRLFEHDITQEEFALQIGVHQSTVSGWTTGASRPRRNVCYRIADYFGLPRAEVVRMAGHKPSMRDEQPHPAPSAPEGTGTKVPLTARQPLAEDVRQDIRDIARSVMEEMGGFVPIRVFGYVPANTTRWAEWENDGRMELYEREVIGSRSPDQFYVLIASGTCMVAQGIPDGASVLMRKLDPGEHPQDGWIVAVRIADEYTLKVWSIEDGRTRLRDGDGNLIAELDNQEDVQVLGVAVRASTNLLRKRG